jgi:RNA polymerase sigma-70 factor (ECF subfamily)
MMGICYRYAGDNHTAQDLLHDGFLKIFNSIRSFNYRGEGSLRAWMSKIFTNTCLEFLRKHNKNLAVERILEDEKYGHIPQDDDDAGGDDYLSLVPDEALAEFIAQLPAGYRTVFNLYVIEDVSHKEIAELLGINESSSRSQLSRAKNILSEKIKKYAESCTVKRKIS